MALVDSVSGAGGAELMVDAWELDFVLTGSQKALALPAGLAFAVASPDYVERAASVRHYGGLGLGLYIARHIVLAHRGALRVESELGKGSTFVVELPLERTEAEGLTAVPGT